MAKKELEFSIVQEGIEYSATVKNVESTDKDEILKQINSKLFRLMLLRKQTGQQCGLKLNKEIGFIFKIGRKTINTLAIAESLNVRLTIGNSNARRSKFFNTVGHLVGFMLEGTKKVTNKRYKEMEAEMEAILSDEKAVRLSKEVAAEMEVSAN